MQKQNSILSGMHRSTDTLTPKVLLHVYKHTYKHTHTHIHACTHTHIHTHRSTNYKFPHKPICEKVIFLPYWLRQIEKSTFICPICHKFVPSWCPISHNEKCVHTYFNCSLFICVLKSLNSYNWDCLKIVLCSFDYNS